MKKINYNTIEVEYNSADYPDFADAMAVYAEYEDGTELTEDELEEISQDLIHEVIFDKL